MADQPAPRRRFQFRLWTLLIGVTLVAVACGYVGRQLERKGDQDAALQLVKKLRGTYTVWYLVEHEMHHKGQISLYLHMCGIEAPFFAFVLPAGVRPDKRAFVPPSTTGTSA